MAAKCMTTNLPLASVKEYVFPSSPLSLNSGAACPIMGWPSRAWRDVKGIEHIIPAKMSVCNIPVMKEFLCLAVVVVSNRVPLLVICALPDSVL